MEYGTHLIEFFGMLIMLLGVGADAWQRSRRPAGTARTRQFLGQY